MKLSYSIAPAHRLRACAGAFFICILFSFGCDKAPGIGGGDGDRTLELTGDTIDLASGVTLHDVKVKAAQNVDFEPSQVAAKATDIVRFTVADTRTHALHISAAPDAEALLQKSGQLRSPPLVSAGQAWVLSLKGLPAGTYTVGCLSHAGTAVITVQ